MKMIDKLERKFGKYAIKNLITYIIFANVIVLILSWANPSFIQNITFDPSKVLEGQIWRIVTFLFIPPSANILFMFFVLYIDYLIGTSLEREWGAFKFNAYYFLGALGIIMGSFITKIPMDNYYLNLSLFLAFAKIFPDFELLIFFVLPVKIKYLGWLSWGLFFLSILMGTTATRIAIILAVLNYFIFFGRENIVSSKRSADARTRKKTYLSKSKHTSDHFHQCFICKRTEKDDPELEFRFCSKCNGNYEYCMEHLFTHEHVKK